MVEGFWSIRAPSKTDRTKRKHHKKHQLRKQNDHDLQKIVVLLRGPRPPLPSVRRGGVELDVLEEHNVLIKVEVVGRVDRVSWLDYFIGSSHSMSCTMSYEGNQHRAQSYLVGHVPCDLVVSALQNLVPMHLQSNVGPKVKIL